MKLWAKTLGFYKILAISLLAVLLNHFFGNEKVNLPTLASGIHFIPTALSSLLTVVIPTIVYFNKSRLPTKAPTKINRISRLPEGLILPILVCLVVVISTLFQLGEERWRALVVGTLVLGAGAETSFRTSPKISPFIPSLLFITLKLMSENGYEDFLNLLEIQFGFY